MALCSVRTAHLAAALVASLLAAACSRKQASSMPASGAQCEVRSVETSSGSLHTRIVYDYDPAGRVVRAEWEYHEIVPETRGAVRTFEYDAAGRLTKQTLDEDLDGKPDEITRYLRDASGRTIGTESLSDSGEVRSTADFDYDDAGRRTGTVWRRKSVPTATETITYSADGRQRVTRSTRANGTEYSHTRQELTDAGLPARIYAIQAGGETLVTETTFDSAGRVVAESTFDPTDHRESKKTYRYDARGMRTDAELVLDGRLSLRSGYSYRGTWAGGVCGDLPEE